MGVSERLACAVVDDDLSWSALNTRPVEYVAALSAATSLGSDIFRARDHDRFALRRAVMLLAKKAIDAGAKAKLPLSSAMAQAMSVTVLMELLHPKCRTCNGSAVVVTETLKVECPTCDGTGIHRYSDKERARLTGVKPDDWPKLASRYRVVLDLAIRNDCAPWTAKEKLGT